jgi:ribonucleoside-triphosphate reductase
MDVKIKLGKSFQTCINRLSEKYGEKFQQMNGFATQNLNFTDFIDNFVDSSNVADVTIDSNANSNTKDVRTLMSDMTKPHLKLLSYNKIFYELTKKYGLATAEEWLENEWNGALYLHDAPSSSLIPYCYAYDLDKVVERGLFFVNKFKTESPKHLTTYNDHVLEFISWTSNRSSGAVGLPSYLVYSYYFWYNDVKNNFYLKDPEYYRRQCFQKFIYDLNQPYLRITECAFTNISIMDRNYLIELFGSRKFPDGEYVIDHIDQIIEYQKAFMEVVSEVRNKMMFTFPVEVVAA